MKIEKRWIPLNWVVITLLMLSLVVTLPLGSSFVSADSGDYTLEGYQNTSENWVSSVLNGTHSTYPEGGVIPFRTEIESGADGRFQIEYAYNNGTKYFFDYLTTPPTMGGSYSYIGKDSGPTAPTGDDGSGHPVGTNWGYYAIPGGTGYFWTNGTSFDWSTWSTVPFEITSATGPVTDGENRQITIYHNNPSWFTSGWVVWGGHLASEADYGPGNGASSYPGASRKMGIHYDWTTPRHGDPHYKFKDIISINSVINPPGPPPTPVYWTFDQIGVGSNYTGTILMIDGTPVPVDLLTTSYTVSFLVGSSHTLAYGTPLVADTGIYQNLQRYVLNYISSTLGGPTSNGSFTVGTGSDGTAVTGHYDTENKLTVLNGGHGTTSGTGWYPEGETATFSISPTTVGGGLGTRYVFTDWTGTYPGSYDGSESTYSVTMNNPITETANWKTQYYLTVNNGGHGSTTGEGWYDAGMSATFSISPTTVPGSTGTQYVFTHWDGKGSGSYDGSDPTHSVIMNNPIKETAKWKTQYYLTVISPYDTPGGEGWYDKGDWAHATLQDGVVYEGSPYQQNTMHVFSDWDGDASGTGLTSNGIKMCGPRTAIADWDTWYYLTVISPYDTPGGEGWYEAGTNAQATLTTGTVEPTPNYIKYEFNQWSDDATGSGLTSDDILMDSAKTATALWDTYYYLTVTTNYGTVFPADGYYLEGTPVGIGAISGGDPDWVWSGWTGTNHEGGTGAYTGTLIAQLITMDNPITEAALWTYAPAPPGGGGTSSVNAEQNVIMIDVMGNIEAHPVGPNGALLSDVSQSSPDGTFTLDLAAGTIPVEGNGVPAYENYSPFYHTVDPDVVVIAAGTIASAPEGASTVQAFQVLPEGLEFRVYDATIASTYAPTSIPEGKSVVWSSYDANAQEWVNMETSGAVAGGTEIPNSVATRVAGSGYFTMFAE